MCNFYHKINPGVHSIIKINAVYNTSSRSLAGWKTNNDLHKVQYLLKMPQYHPADSTYPRVNTGAHSILASGPAASSST